MAVRYNSSLIMYKVTVFPVLRLFDLLRYLSFSNFVCFRKLRYLNLSYNQISDLKGFIEVKHSSHVLEQVELFGNRISNLKHTLQCLRDCGHLKRITLQNKEDSNPVCSLPAYKPNMFSQLTRLEILDGRDRVGNKKMPEIEIPG